MTTVTRHVRAKNLASAFNKVHKTFNGKRMVNTSGKMESDNEYHGMKLYQIYQVERKKK
jgi:hypothetical protein